MRDPNELIDINLNEDERYVLHRGLVEWGGPASCTDAMAIAMGFTNVRDLLDQTDRLLAELDAGQPMSRWDWTRVLLATEIVFVSDVIGSGSEWPSTTGLDDARTLQVLRELQRKLMPALARISAQAVRRNPSVSPRHC